MMRSRRPPDILRKSHAHSSGKGRAKAKRALERELEAEEEASDTNGPDEDGERKAARRVDDKRRGRD